MVIYSNTENGKVNLLFVLRINNPYSRFMPGCSSSQDSRFLRENPTAFVEAGPFRFHYLHRGGGRPLLMIHGGGIWLYSFRHNVGPLSRRFSVYVPDMPGYGFSSVGERAPMDNGTMVRAIGAFMDAMGIAKASLAGHSWGGGWALDFAEACPGRVEKLVLIDTAGLDVPDAFEWELLKLPVIGPLLFSLLTPGIVRKNLPKSFYNRDLADEEMAREVFLNFRDRKNRNAQARHAGKLSWKQTEAGLRSLPHPVLLIWGQEDRYLPVRLVERFRSRIRNLRIEIIPRSGHAPHEECPETVNRLIADFLEKK